MADKQGFAGEPKPAPKLPPKQRAEVTLKQAPKQPTEEAPNETVVPSPETAPKGAAKQQAKVARKKATKTPREAAPKEVPKRKRQRRHQSSQQRQHEWKH